MLPSFLGTKNLTKVPLRQSLLEFLKIKEFKYETADDENPIILPLSGENGYWKMFFHIDEEREILEIRSYCPYIIKENQKLRIAELITRINARIMFGCFSMDFEGGNLVFKTLHLTKDTELSYQILDILFITNAQTIDEFMPAINAVNSGYTEPCLAIQ